MPAAVVRLQAEASIPHDTSALLPSLDVPTLIVHGDEDEMLDVANALHLAELIPGARLEVLPGGGHMFWWEQPERSAALVAAHVTARAAAAPRSSGSGP
jgi:pimeloyl-ACP methyl ester carboxylesterase